MVRAAPDFRTCLIAVATHFGKDNAIASTLPQGPIDEDNFLYFIDKCGLAVEETEQAPPIEMGIPCIALFRNGRCAFIRFVGREEAEIVSDEGRRRASTHDLAFEEAPERYLMVLVRADAKTHLNMFSRFPWFWGPISRNSWAYIQVAMASLMTNLLSLSVSIFMLVVYDRVVPNKSWDSLVALTIGVGGAIIMDFVIRLIRAHFVEIAGQQIDLSIGRALFDKIFEARIEALRGGIGALANVFKEAEQIRTFFTSVSLMAFIDLPFVFLFVAVIYWIAGWLAVIPLACLPIVAIFGLVIQPLLLQRAADSFAKGGSKQNVIVETLGGIETLRTLSASSYMRRRWMERVAQQSATEKSGRTLANSAVSFTVFIQQMSQVAVIVVGVMLIDSRNLTMGALVASVMLTSRAVAPLAQLAQMLVSLNHARMAFASVDHVMKAPVNRDPLRQYTRRPHLAGKIEFRNVSFAYPGQPLPTLMGASFKIEAGEKVAILGRIGSGKSTITKLMLGLYQANDGAILFDDIDSRQIDPADLQDNLSAMLQDVWLFSGSVRENITIGRPDSTDEEVLSAATLSATHDLISQNPLGYDLGVGERGLTLSGGQRQSIALARTLLRDTPVVLMDEPTSMMDFTGEATLISRLKPAMEDKTLILITHRTSMLDLVDRVILVDQGRIVGDGPKANFTAGVPVPAPAKAQA